MSLGDFVHSCYISPHDYSNWQRPSVQAQTGSKVQGRKLEHIQAHFISHAFLLKYPVWDGHINRGYAFTWLLLYTPQRLSDPKTISEVPFWMGIESWENAQKTEFNWSVKKQEEICKSSNMLFIKLKWSCVCVYFPRSLYTSKSAFDLYDWIPPRLQKQRLMQILLI